MVSPSRHRRKNRTFSVKLRFIPAVIVLLAVSVSVSAFWLLSGRPIAPVSLLIVSDPMMIAVYNGPGVRPSLVVMPADIQISGLYGVGPYSLDSLWKLEHLDDKNKNLLMESLEEAIGLPIGYSLNAGGEELEKQSGDGTAVRNILSPRSWWELSMRSDDSVRLRDLIWIWWYFKTADNAGWNSINISSSALDMQKLPDGSTIKTLSSRRLDQLTDDSLEYINFRQEAISISVYNTTKIPFVGQRISRLLDTIGIHVISIDNSEPELTKCDVIGEREVLTSQTAQFIIRHLRCREIVSPTNETADIVIRIGTDYSARFGSTR